MRTLSFYVLILFSCMTAQATDKPGLTFIENKNQWNREVLYRADIHGGAMFLKDKGFSFVFYDKRNKEALHFQDQVSISDSGEPLVEQTTSAWHLTFSFLNATSVKPIGCDDTGVSYNYFLGNDRNTWTSDARAFQRVMYTNLYEQIDMQVYSSGPHAKYDLIVHAGGDPSCIEWQYGGAVSLMLDEGNLQVQTHLGDVVEKKPYAHQIKNEHKIEVPVAFVLDGTTLRYNFPEGYDTCYDLIIDPILIFSAYSGSTSDNWGNTATYDSKGNTYSGGIVNASTLQGFPVTIGAYQDVAKGGAWDMGILKYDSSGAKLLYATYLGGNGVETPQSLVVDKDDNLLILGATSSENFPGAITSFKGGTNVDPIGAVPYSSGSDIFITKLSRNGSDLLASTYFGGEQNDGINFISGAMGSNTKVESPLARNYGDQLRGDIVVADDNSIFIASNTLSSDVPASLNSFLGGSHDALIASFNSDLSIRWSRYLGGSKTDAAYSIKLREASVLVAGGTESTDIETMNGFKPDNAGGIDGWIAEISLDGTTLLGGTYLGTNAYDQIYFIDVNEAGEVYAFGQTQGAYPIQGNVYRNANGGQFIHKLSSDLKSSILSTVIGSGGNTPNISPTAFLVSDCDNLYLSGWGGITNATIVATQNGGILVRNYVGGSTSGLPTTSDGFQRNTSGSDFYFMVLSADASQFLYGTFLGGSTSRTHVDGGTSRFDKQGIVYHAVCAGCGGQSDFPAVNVSVAHRTNRSTNCNNAVFKFDLSLLRARFQTNNETRTLPGLTTVCIPDGIVFQNFSSGGEFFQWDLGDGTPTKLLLDTASFVHHYQEPGEYTVTLTAIDQGTCKVRDVATKKIRVNESVSEVQDDAVICGGEIYQLQASGAVSYTWLSDDGEVLNGATVVVEPEQTKDYYVTLQEATGCVRLDTVTIEVIPALMPEFKLEKEASCLERPVVILENTKTDSVEYTFVFDLGDGTTSDLSEVRHSYEKDSVYSIRLTAQREFCEFQFVQPVEILSILIPNVLTPTVKDGKNDVFTIRYGKEGTTPGDRGLKVDLIVYNRWGTIVFESEDYQYNWSGADLASGVYFYEVTIKGYATCKDWLHLIK